MPKPKIPNQRKANLQHKKRVEQYAVLIQQIYDSVAKEAARHAVLAGADPEKPFNFADYPLTKEAIKKLQSQLMDEVSGIILRGTSEEWKESNLIQDLVAKKVLTAYTGTSKYGDEYSRYFQTNPDALKAFQERKDRGMNLSSSVWNLSEQYKSELEESITAAMAPGTSAMSLATQVKQYLKEPNKRFRRIKEKLADGTIKWHLSNPAKAYHPGQGVYRSSARNAQRLARTEINMSYRTAEQERWKQFDFVVGYEVKTTQNGHHVEDMCDMLAGKYPKTFQFTGWHPQCMCYCIPILKTEDEFWADDDVKSVNEVTDVPQNFKEWIRDNEDRINAAEKRGNLPYFIRDNKDDIENVLHPEWFENLKYFSKEDFKSIQEGNFFGAGSIIKLNDIFIEKGFTEDEIKQLSHLIDMHRHGGENQADVDIEIALLFRDKDNRIGSMLRMQSEIEEEAYRIYRYKNPPIQIVRAGDLSRDTFSFTMNKSGVVKNIDGEEVYWGADIKTTLDNILKENKLIAGLLRSDIGYSDERELFFISKKPKQLTDSFVKEWKDKQEQKRIEAERIERLKEFNQQKNDVAIQLMTLMSKGVPMEKIMELQQNLIGTVDGDLQSLSRIRTLANATERHAARKPKDVARIQNIWDKRKEYISYSQNPNYTDVSFNYDNGGLKALHRQHNIDSDKGWYETFVQDMGYRNGHKVILESEFSNILHKKFTEGTWDGYKFELATRETATDNNILRGLKHCADKKETEIAILYFPNGGFTEDKIQKAIKRYKGYKNFPERTYVDFKRIICVTNDGIVYDAPF